MSQEEITEEVKECSELSENKHTHTHTYIKDCAMQINQGLDRNL